LLDSAAADGRQLSPAELGRMSAAVLANREIHATMSAIEQAGGEARYVTVDITDSDAVAAAMAEVRADMGPITAVIHGAGVLADKLIADKTDRQFDTVFGTKVLGLDALLAATADDPLVLLCLFSSVAASAGNAGQSDYAMANEVLNTVAVAEAARRGPGCVVKSIGWGPWDGGMVAPALKAHFQSMGVGVIPLAEGARLFVDEIAGAQSDQVDVVIGAAAMVATARAMAVDRVDA